MMSNRRTTWTSLMLVTIGIGSHFSWPMSPSGPGLHRTSSDRWACRLHLARSHSRMENSMRASIPVRADVSALCVAPSDGRIETPIAGGCVAEVRHRELLRRDGRNGVGTGAGLFGSIESFAMSWELCPGRWFRSPTVPLGPGRGVFLIPVIGIYASATIRRANSPLLVRELGNWMRADGKRWWAAVCITAVTRFHARRPPIEEQRR